MRFRAKIVDAACLNHFTRVSCMVAKLARACTLRIRPHKLNFILADSAAGGGVSMWCELPQENFFSEFQMEGVSAESNEIYVELTSENLFRALKTAQNARSLKVKLTNKHFPCLTVSIELTQSSILPRQASASHSSRMVTHDIPIKVIPRKLWRNLQEPAVPDSDVSIYLPVLKTMKSVVEKMKNISNHLIIEANLNGDLNLKIETEVVCVTTHFKDLGNPPLTSENATQDRDPEQMAEVHVDIRKFLQFLAGQQGSPTRAVCNIVSHKMVHFDLLHEDVSLQYFIPALS